MSEDLYNAATRALSLPMTSQAEAARAIDAQISGVMDGGFAQSGRGTWCSRTGATRPNVRVWVQRGVELLGNEGQVSVDNIVVGLLEDELGATPQSGDTVTVADERFRLDQPLTRRHNRHSFTVKVLR